MRRAAALAALLLATACSSSSSPPSAQVSRPGATVQIPLLSFRPDPVTIRAGQTVTWVNGNDIRHVLVEGTYQVGSDGLRTRESSDGAFSLKVAKAGDTVSHTYPKAGTFTYYCSIHKGMNGTVTVR